MGAQPIGRKHWLRLAAVAAAVALVLGTAVAVAAWWRSTLTTALDRSVSVVHDDQAWEVSPREFDAGPDWGVVTVALKHALTSGAWADVYVDRLARQAAPDAELHVPLNAPYDETAAYVAHLAGQVDHDPHDAAIEVPADPSADEWAITDARSGERVERDVAGQRILHALRTGADEVALPVEEVAPAISSAAAERALPVVQAALAHALDRTLTVVHDDTEWHVTPRELDASPDLEPAIDAALEVAANHELGGPTTDAAPAAHLEPGGLTDAGAAAAHHEPGELTVELSVDREAAADFVADLAADIERSRRDAGIDVAALEVVGARTGLTVDRDAALAAIREAVDERAEQVHVPVDELPPEVPTAAAERALPAVREALEHMVTVTDGDQRWEVTPRALGASADVGAALDAAVADREPRAEDVAVHVDEDAVAGFVAEVAGAVDRSPRHGGMDWSSGWIEVTEPRDGRAVDRGAASAQLHAALDGEADTVELPVQRNAARSDDVPHRVLLLRQNERQLYLYVDGAIVRQWPVAVGMPSNPTPTGVFTVGAKRHRPTWTNPAPNGWGADMPAQVGPGPDNPLGVRALNWNRGGSDTLIRFHGTPDTASIGQAASRGCVRLTNNAVRELYDLVPSGTMIVSLHG